MKKITQYRIAVANTFWLFKRSFQLLPFSSWVRWWFLPASQKTIIIHGVPIALRGRLRDAIVDGYMAVSCLAEEQYNPPGFILQKGETVVDIGGHIGSFALYAASRVGPSGKVFVYEPAPDNNAQLRHNVAQSGFLNVRAYAAAVAGSKGDRRFFYNNANTAMHGLYPYTSGGVMVYQKSNHAFTVPALTLADIFFQNNIARCHFLKIDCEGAEYEILYNTPKNIFEKIDRIAMEYHLPPFYGLNDREHNPEQLAAFLRNTGFAVRMAPENRMHGLLFASKPSAF